VKFWIMIFSAAVFAGGTCLGVALRPKLVPPAAKTAPESWGGYGRGEFSVTRFAHELSLSEDQDSELDRILEETHRDSEAYGRAMRAANDRARERVTALLTGEQKQKLDALLAAEQKRRSEAELRRTVDGYTRILALTPEQSKALSAVLTEARARRHEHFSGQDKKREKESTRAFFRALKEEQTAKLQKALTPEQFATYRDIQELSERFER
jgi:Spy/CpxP family protein refolding chaperone